MVTAERLNGFWKGSSLGPVERACLRSAINHGHTVTLWSYEKPDGIPDGVELRNASEILPADRIILHENGSASLFSNLFRYELQRRGIGVWIDLDVYFVAPFPFEGGHVFAWEGDGLINGAVLRLPADSPILPPLIELFDERSIPFWLPLRHRLAAAGRLVRQGRSGLSRMPWGTTGPKALTALSRRHGLHGLALPNAVFYPMPWQKADWIRDPSLSLDMFCKEETVAIHLWHDVIKRWKNEPAIQGTFLARLQAEGD